MSNPTFERVAGRLIDALLAGDTPEKWRRPWRAVAGSATPGEQPVSLNGRPYGGLNAAVLAFECLERGLDSALPWATYRRWAEQGAQVVKGEKGTHVVLWKPDTRIEENDEGEQTTCKRLLVRSFVVFHASQVTGWDAAKWLERHQRTKPDPKDLTQTWEDLAGAETAAQGYVQGRSKQLVVHHCAGNRACYAPGQHAVTMPLKEQFTSAPAYYSTLFHELAHSTMLPLKRKRETYAREELVAEGAAAMLCGRLGVVHEGHAEEAQHITYLRGWLGRVTRTQAAQALATAMQQASKAATLIVGE